MMWCMLILGLFALLILVYAVLSAASVEDDIMEEFWQEERWKEQERWDRKRRKD